MHPVCSIRQQRNIRQHAQLVDFLLHVTLPRQNTPCAVQIQPPNGTELSRAAEGGVGWSELLCGVFLLGSRNEPLNKIRKRLWMDNATQVNCMKVTESGKVDSHFRYRWLGD